MVFEFRLQLHRVLREISTYGEEREGWGYDPKMMKTAGTDPEECTHYASGYSTSLWCGSSLCVLAVPV